MTKLENKISVSKERKENLISIKAVAPDIFGTATRRYYDIQYQVEALFESNVDGIQFAKDWMDLSIRGLSIRGSIRGLNKGTVLF